MLGHFSHSELACPTTDQVRLASGFGEALDAFVSNWTHQYTSTAPAGRLSITPRSGATLVAFT